MADVAMPATKRVMHRRSFIEELIIQAVAVGGLLLSLRLALKYLDPYREQRDQAKKRAAFLKKVLGRSLDLNEFEQLLAANVINPKHIDVRVEDVSGLDDLIQDLELRVILPMINPDLYCTTLWKPARGVLLYGPPGTGKTMLAKALAKHSNCFFLNITASSIMSKWLGDASRLVKAIFTLAEKLQPCIIFIDEVDSLLAKRGSHQEHEASLQVKTEFMQLWDGMESTRGQRIVVMGATNRPGIVDEAVLRRFSIQHEVGLPNRQQRAAILRSYLTRHTSELGQGAVDPALLKAGPSTPSTRGGGAAAPSLPGRREGGGAEGEGGATSTSGGARGLDWLAGQTEGFSGSDLMELCSQAAQRVLNEFLLSRRDRTRARAAAGGAGGGGAAAGRRGGGRGSAPRLGGWMGAGAGGGRAGRGAEGEGPAGEEAEEEEGMTLRPLTADDFAAVLQTMRPSTSKAVEFNQASGSVDPALLLQLMAKLMGQGAPVEDP